MKKEKFFFIAIIFLTLTGYIFDVLTKKETAQLYNEFYNADLNGKIEKVGIKRHGAGVKLSNNPKEFVFYPGSSLNGNNDFLDFADRGDSVVKLPKSDTLFLIKNNKPYLYRFSKLK